MSTINRLSHFHQQYIANTALRAHVIDNAFYVGSVSPDTSHKLNLTTPIIIISTRTLKHLYDKRTARVYDFLIQNFHDIISFPDLLLKPSHDRNGFAIVKFFEEHAYYCSLETTLHYNYIVTAFMIDEKYLAKQKIIQDWRI